jgi:hypothetical protein
MPAKDIYHDNIKNALIKDGWTITNDPYVIQWGRKDLFIDLGTEKLIAAFQNGRKIAVEVKSFISPSPISDLEKALGQYILYLDILARLDPDRTLYLAIRQDTFIEIFQDPIGEILLENKRLKLLVFDEVKEEILQWIV